MNKFVMFLTLSFGLVNIVNSQDVVQKSVTFEEALKYVHSLRGNYSNASDQKLDIFFLFNDHILNEQDQKGKTLLMHIFECGLYNWLTSIIDTSEANLRLENNEGKNLLDLIRDHLEIDIMSDSNKNNLLILKAKIEKWFTDHRDEIKRKVWAATNNSLWFRSKNDPLNLSDDELKMFAFSNELHQLTADYV